EKLERQKVQRELEKSRLQAELKAARDSGDDDDIERIFDKMLDIKAEEKAQPKPAQAVDPRVQAEINDFGVRNPWLQENPRLQACFTKNLRDVLEMRVAKNIGEALDMAKDWTKREHPEHFGSSRQHSMVDSGDEGASRGGGKRSWSEVKPE